jgi:hypothetical protein
VGLHGVPREEEFAGDLPQGEIRGHEPQNGELRLGRQLGAIARGGVPECLRKLPFFLHEPRLPRASLYQLAQNVPSLFERSAGLGEPTAAAADPCEQNESRGELDA